MQPAARPVKEHTAGLWQGLWRWLILLPLIAALIFFCSLTSHVGLGYPVPGEIRSNMRATYAPWERVEMAPISTAIIQDLPEWQGTSPEDIAQPGNIWDVPTFTPPVQPLPSPTPTIVEISFAPATVTPTTGSLPTQPLITLTPRPTSTLPFWIPTVTRTPSPTLLFPITLTPTFTRTPTLPIGPTRTATPTATRTPTTLFSPTVTRTPTTLFSPTATRTLTPVFTSTSTLPSIITPTYTPTLTPPPWLTSTPTPTATITLTPTFTLIPTITLTPSITPTYTPTQPPCGGNIPAGEPDIGPPDGSFASLPCGGLLILDLPALGFNPIDLSVPDSSYDMVFYERRLPPPDSVVIELDWVSIEIGTGPTGACATGDWYFGFNWGDMIVTNNGHLGNLYPEIDNQQIPTDILWGNPPLQTGIAIDLDNSSLGIPSGLYPCIRIISPFNYPDNDPSEIDALEILP